MAVTGRGSPDGLAATALTGAAAFASLVYDPGAPAFDSKSASALAVSIVALGIAAWRGNRRSMRVPPSLVAWVGFVAWSALSATWAPASGWLDLAPWVAGSALAVASLGLGKAAARRCASDTAFVVGSVSSIAALYELASGARGMMVHAGHGNGNWLGLVLAVAIPLSVQRVRDAFRSGDRLAIVLAGLLGTQLAALAASESRTAWVALPVGALMAWPMIKRRVGASLAAAALLLSVLGASTPPGRSAVEAEGAGAGSVTQAWQGRLWIWQTSLDVARQQLPLGSGLGGFGHAYLSAQGERLKALPAPQAARTFENATTAHDDWIQALSESGLPGLAWLLAAVGGAMLALRRDGWRAGAASVASLAVCAMGDSPLRQPAVVVIFSLMLGGAPRGWNLGRTRLAVTVVSLAAGGWLLAPTLARWMADRWEAQSMEATPDRRAKLLERAVELDPRSGSAWLALGLARADLSDCEGAVVALDRSWRGLANVGTQVALGNALMDCGRTEQALAAYEKAMELHPGGFRARANAVEALRELGRFDDARHQLQVARSIYPGHPKLRDIADRLERSVVDAAE